MSLDVYLKMPNAKVPRGSGIFVRENGATVEISAEEWDRRNPDREPVLVIYDDDDENDCVFSANITHNLNTMADHAGGLYEHLWRPDECGVATASQLIEPLRAGLKKLQSEPDYFKKFNPENGWGDYEGLLSFVAKYLSACVRYPDATVEVSR